MAILISPNFTFDTLNARITPKMCVSEKRLVNNNFKIYSFVQNIFSPIIYQQRENVIIYPFWTQRLSKRSLVRHFSPFLVC